MSRTSDLDNMLGTGLGDPVPVKGYRSVDPDLGDPVPAADIDDMDSWLSGGRKRKKKSKVKTSKVKTSKVKTKAKARSKKGKKRGK